MKSFEICQDNVCQNMKLTEAYVRKKIEFKLQYQIVFNKNLIKYNIKKKSVYVTDGTKLAFCINNNS